MEDLLPVSYTHLDVYKRQAQKKLDNERENLVRVNDILTEIERQVGPLQRQSEKAHTYLKKREELKNYCLLYTSDVYKRQEYRRSLMALAD